MRKYNANLALWEATRFGTPPERACTASPVNHPGPKDESGRRGSEESVSSVLRERERRQKKGRRRLTLNALPLLTGRDRCLVEALMQLLQARWFRSRSDLGRGRLRNRRVSFERRFETKPTTLQVKGRTESQSELATGMEKGLRYTLQKKKPPEKIQNPKVAPIMMHDDERETARIMSGVGRDPSGRGETIPVVHLPYIRSMADVGRAAGERGRWVKDGEGRGEGRAR